MFDGASQVQNQQPEGAVAMKDDISTFEKVVVIITFIFLFVMLMLSFLRPVSAQSTPSSASCARALDAADQMKQGIEDLAIEMAPFLHSVTDLLTSLQEQDERSMLNSLGDMANYSNSAQGAANDLVEYKGRYERHRANCSL